MTELRQGLPPLPERMKHLPLNYQGFPTPWFVAWYLDGKPCEPGTGEPDFRVIDSPKIAVAVKQERCWICGGFLGRHLAFVIGPMCAINRVISEPPSHRECAIFSATACPFLSQPRMRRDEKDLPTHQLAAGEGIKRNPGVTCVWTTRSYRPFRPQIGAPGVLFELGEPEEVLWFARGRSATREEVIASIDSGYPSLVESAARQGMEAVRELDRYRKRVMPLLPEVSGAPR